MTKPKPLLLSALAAAVLGGALLAPAPSSGQAGAANQINSDDTAFGATLTEVAAQQMTILDNEAKMEAKLAAITENLRIARIYVGRGGGKAGAR